jgi:hypothetical protein
LNGDPPWLPPLVLLADHDGDWNLYLQALYEHFCRDFVSSCPQFGGRRVRLKRHPVTDSKEATFWHVISEGREEANRTPDIRRCERIQWPCALIESAGTDRVNCWKNSRKGETRIVIALTDFSYVVVLSQRNDYLVLWTAYCIEQQHRREKLRKEYESATKS